MFAAISKQDQFTKRRNERLLKYKKSCCEKGRGILQDIEDKKEMSSFYFFRSHAAWCSTCRHILVVTDKEVEEEMS